jgi:hypothetical protein
VEGRGRGGGIDQERWKWMRRKLKVKKDGTGEESGSLNTIEVEKGWS